MLLTVAAFSKKAASRQLTVQVTVDQPTLISRLGARCSGGVVGVGVPEKPFSQSDQALKGTGLLLCRICHLLMYKVTKG